MHKLATPEFTCGFNPKSTFGLNAGVLNQRADFAGSISCSSCAVVKRGKVLVNILCSLIFSFSHKVYTTWQIGKSIKVNSNRRII